MKLFCRNSLRIVQSMTFGFFALYGSATLAFEVVAGNAPESSLELVVGAIQSAKTSLHINIYEMTSTQIANAIIGQIKKGLHVEILEEGQPVGGLSQDGKNILNRILQTIQQYPKSRYYLMTSHAGKKRRFRFDHAKYIIVDGTSVLVGSENFSPTGHSELGTVGNRGWEAWVHDLNTTQSFYNLFKRDVDLSFQDILDLTPALNCSAIADNQNNLFQTIAFDSLAPNSSSLYHPISLSASDIQIITSPETSLSGLIAALRSARHSIDIEQLTFDSTWGGHGTSPLFEEVIEAARRGIQIRVLMNDDGVFARRHGGGPVKKPTKSKNISTMDLVNQLAKNENLNISARIANVAAMGVTYVHNKGILIDHDKTLISSINWNANSVENNRETAILISSEAVYSYYAALFEKDWVASSIAPY